MKADCLVRREFAIFGLFIVVTGIAHGARPAKWGARRTISGRGQHPQEPLRFCVVDVKGASPSSSEKLDGAIYPCEPAMGKWGRVDFYDRKTGAGKALLASMGGFFQKK